MPSTRKKEPKTALQELFLKRVREEMKHRGIPSTNALANRAGAPRQSTLNDVMNGADPSLETVTKIAFALGVEPWRLLVEEDPAVRKRTTVATFPQPSSMFAKKDDDRKKHRA